MDHLWSENKKKIKILDAIDSTISIVYIRHSILTLFFEFFLWISLERRND